MTSIEKHLGLLFFILCAVLIVHSYIDNYPYLYSTILSYNSDALYPEHYARDILSGASIWDWQNLQAPYFFPDIFLQFVMVISGVSAFTSTNYYILLSVLIFFTGWSFAASRCGLASWKLCAAIAVAGIISLLCLSGDKSSTSWLHTVIYQHLCGHHGGYALALPFMAWLSARALHTQDKLVVVIHIALSSMLFLSDMLFCLIFAGPLTLWVLYLYIKKVISLRATLKWLSMLITAFLISRIFSWLSPYPNDSGYIALLKSIWPGSVPVALAAFSQHLKDYYFSTHGISGLLGLSTVLCLVYLLHWIFRQSKSLPASEEDLTAQFLAVMAAIGFLAVITIQLGLGIYGSVAHSRQFVASIVMMPIVVFILWARGSHIAANSNALAVLSIVGLVSLLLPLRYGAQETRISYERPKLISCYNKLAKENHLNGILVDYWIARSLIITAKDEIRYTVVTNDMWPFLGGNNIKKGIENEPNAIMVWDDKSVEYALHFFGKPRQILSCASEPGLEKENGRFALYDYSGNERLKEWFTKSRFVTAHQELHAK